MSDAIYIIGILNSYILYIYLYRFRYIDIFAIRQFADDVPLRLTIYYYMKWKKKILYRILCVVGILFVIIIYILLLPTHETLCCSDIYRKRYRKTTWFVITGYRGVMSRGGYYELYHCCNNWKKNYVIKSNSHYIIVQFQFK